MGVLASTSLIWQASAEGARVSKQLAQATQDRDSLELQLRAAASDKASFVERSAEGERLRGWLRGEHERVKGEPPRHSMAWHGVA